ncbi:MAG: TetR/AcrR family transcriptional regulator [Candidatus Binatia bacterium]
MTHGESAVSSHEAGSTRDLILDAAERRFAQHGFSGVAMREIAADVGLKNQASLYHHFRNKRALYEAVLARGLDPILALMAESAKAGETAPLERRSVDANLDRLLDYLVEHPYLPRLIQRGLDDSRYLRNAIPKLLFPLSAEGLSLLADAAGPWEPEDLKHLAAGIYHLIFGYFANTALIEVVLRADPSSPQAVARQRRFVKIAIAQLLGLGDDHKKQSAHA